MKEHLAKGDSGVKNSIGAHSQGMAPWVVMRSGKGARADDFAWSDVAHAEAAFRIAHSYLWVLSAHGRPVASWDST